jgi:PAS domain-containing protein
VIDDVLDGSETRLRRLMDVIDIGYCVAEMVVDDDGHPIDARIVETNPAFGPMAGLRDPVGRTILEMAPDVGAGWLEAHAREILDGRTVRYEQHAPAIGKWFDVFRRRWIRPVRSRSSSPTRRRDASPRRRCG